MATNEEARAIKTKRLRLVPLDAAHADELMGLIDPRVTEHFLSEDAPSTKSELREQYRAIENAARHITSAAQFNALTVRLARSEQAIGRIEALVHGPDAEIAFVFVAASWSQGYATEAVRALASELKAGGVKRLWACVAPGNAASLVLCKRLSFEPCVLPGTFEAATFDDGDDVLMVEL
ncbi:MAG: GNAT family protein [Pseudomonadota bacterium]